MVKQGGKPEATAKAAAKRRGRQVSAPARHIAGKRPASPPGDAEPSVGAAAAAQQRKAKKGVDPLEYAIKDMLEKLRPPVRKKIIFNLRQIKCFRVGSLCSGSEVQCVAGKKVVEGILGKHRATYETAFSCEADERKALKWIEGVVHTKHGTQGQCIFKDVSALGCSTSWCVVHKKACEIPGGCNLAVGSWSCKDYSKLKVNGSRTGSTSSTLQGILDYLNNHRPLMYVGENLDDIVKADVWLEISHSFAEVDYACGMQVMKADEYGATTSRKRAYIIAFECRLSGLALEAGFAIINEIHDLVGSMKIPTARLDEVLLPDDHPYVAGELARRQQQTQHVTQDTLWQGQLFTLLEQKGLTWSGIMAPAEQQASPWFATLVEREQMNIGCSHRTK